MSKSLMKILLHDARDYKRLRYYHILAISLFV